MKVFQHLHAGKKANKAHNKPVVEHRQPKLAMQGDNSSHHELGPPVCRRISSIMEFLTRNKILDK